jgi:hypothetical protein
MFPQKNKTKTKQKKFSNIEENKKFLLHTHLKIPLKYSKQKKVLPQKLWKEKHTNHAL